MGRKSSRQVCKMYLIVLGAAATAGGGGGAGGVLAVAAAVAGAVVAARSTTARMSPQMALVALGSRLIAIHAMVTACERKA